MVIMNTAQTLIKQHWKHYTTICLDCSRLEDLAQSRLWTQYKTQYRKMQSNKTV